VFGRFDDEVRPWTGTLQALYSDRLADLDGGYGAKLETAPVHPVLACLAFPWESPERFDDLMEQLPHISVIGTLLRDRSGGRVTLDRRGRPSVRYRLSRYDQRHTRAAVEGAARVLLAAGAREIFSAQNRRVSFTPGGRESLDDWMRRVDRAGYGPNRMLYVTFHQMGGCRMGADPARFVVDGRGESHTVKNLYVADGSLFPTASGANPMISIVALGHYVAQQVASA
jgi:choline dehydrogenase-like flavoprotein